MINSVCVIFLDSRIVYGLKMFFWENNIRRRIGGVEELVNKKVLSLFVGRKREKKEMEVN